MARGYTTSDSLRRVFVFLQIGGEVVDFWQSYTVTADVLGPNGMFSLECPALPREIESRGNQQAELDARGIARGQLVKVYLKTPEAPKPVLQATSLIDDVELEEEREGGARVKVTGRDHLARIVDCDVLPSIGLENITYTDVVKKLLTERMPGQPAPFFSSADIVIDNDANRVLLTGKPAASSSIEKFTIEKAAQIAATSPKASAKKVANLVQKTIDQVKPHPGETVYEFLARHAKRFGLMIWGTADGKVVIGRPNYDQKPLYQLSLRQGVRGVGNTVLSLRRHKSFKHRPSEVHVYGHTSGGDYARSTIHAVAYDTEVQNAGLWRVLTVHDQNARTKEQAEHRAHFELSVRRQTGDVLHAMVQGHAADDGAVYAIDTIADIAWDKGDINESRYVAARTFVCNNQGTFTHLEIIPKNSIVLEPETS